MKIYNKNNVFAKIINGEISCKKIYEDEDTLCFEDIKKDAPVHLLVIPKRYYSCYEDFVTNSDEAYIAKFFKTVAIIAKNSGIVDGYRLITNNGSNAGQTVFHFHIHILARMKTTEL